MIHIGLNNDLERSAYEHMHKLVRGFTQKCNVNQLMYFEQIGDKSAAQAKKEGDQQVAAGEDEQPGQWYESWMG